MLSHFLGSGTIRTHSLPCWSLELFFLEHNVPLVKTCLCNLAIFPQPMMRYLDLGCILRLHAECLLHSVRCDVRVLFYGIFSFFNCSDLFRLPYRHTAILLNNKRWIGPVVEWLRVLICLFKSFVKGVLAAIFQPVDVIVLSILVGLALVAFEERRAFFWRKVFVHSGK